MLRREAERLARMDRVQHGAEASDRPGQCDAWIGAAHQRLGLLLHEGVGGAEQDAQMTVALPFQCPQETLPGVARG